MKASKDFKKFPSHVCPFCKSSLSKKGQCSRCGYSEPDSEKADK